MRPSSWLDRLRLILEHLSPSSLASGSVLPKASAAAAALMANQNLVYASAGFGVAAAIAMWASRLSPTSASSDSSEAGVSAVASLVEQTFLFTMESPSADVRVDPLAARKLIRLLDDTASVHPTTSPPSATMPIPYDRKWIRLCARLLTEARDQAAPAEISAALEILIRSPPELFPYMSVLIPSGSLMPFIRLSETSPSFSLAALLIPLYLRSDLDSPRFLLPFFVEAESLLSTSIRSPTDSIRALDALCHVFGDCAPRSPAAPAPSPVVEDRRLAKNIESLVDLFPLHALVQLLRTENNPTVLISSLTCIGLLFRLVDVSSLNWRRFLAEQFKGTNVLQEIIFCIRSYAPLMALPANPHGPAGTDIAVVALETLIAVLEPAVQGSDKLLVALLLDVSADLLSTLFDFYLKPGAPPTLLRERQLAALVFLAEVVGNASETATAIVLEHSRPFLDVISRDCLRLAGTTRIRRAQGAASGLEDRIADAALELVISWFQYPDICRAAMQVDVLLSLTQMMVDAVAVERLAVLESDKQQQQQQQQQQQHPTALYSPVYRLESILSRAFPRWFAFPGMAPLWPRILMEQTGFVDVLVRCMEMAMEWYLADRIGSSDSQVAAAATAAVSSLSPWRTVWLGGCQVLERLQQVHPSLAGELKERYRFDEYLRQLLPLVGKQDPQLEGHLRRFLQERLYPPRA